MKYLLALFAIVIGGPALAQAAGTTGYLEVQSANSQPHVVGYLVYKICEVKQLMIMLAYILAGVAFLFKVMMAFFTKFEAKPFLIIVGGVLAITVADMIVAFFAGGGAFYCPLAISNF